MKITPTACCALAQLSCNNEDTLEDITATIQLLMENAESKSWLNTPADAGGQRAVFVITTPTEHELAVKLQTLGFHYCDSFSRRKGYLPGELSMWLLSW